MSVKPEVENSSMEPLGVSGLNNGNWKLSGRNIRAIAITGGENVPSRRFRIDVLAPFLAKQNIELTELCASISSYPPSSQLLRLPWFVGALAERFTMLHRSRGYDVVILQRELISTLPTLERLLPKPLVLDVDDAIYLHRDGRTAEYIASSCSLVVCGNHYLAEKFLQWNPNVVVIPTGVDTDQLRPIVSRDITDSPSIIGWIGTSGNFVYLESIEPALTKVLSCFPKTRFQIISNKFPAFLNHLGEQLDFRLWRPGIENELLPRFSVGIMPLADTEWARGKCAFKMLQYMAAGVPVVVSPVGINREIVDIHDVGLTAVSQSEWTEALSMFLITPNSRARAGENGRRVAESKYSLSSVADQWRVALVGLLGG
jgi:glycosyltransferase involved in cell wall biosynthesis